MHPNQRTIVEFRQNVGFEIEILRNGVTRVKP